MLDKNTLEEIRRFDSITEAMKFLGKSSKTGHIGDVCNGKRGIAYGYRWKWC